jgi:hypothetical protein
MKILLVEPAYYTRYPPLGLLKLAAYHRDMGDEVELVRGCVNPTLKPNRIYVTSLFTWAWKPVWQAVAFYKKMFSQSEVWLGGLYASLMPDHAKESGADYIHIGLYNEAENYMPAYDLIPEWDGSIIFASRGCNRSCPYCCVWRIEGKINNLKRSLKDLIYPTHTRVILWDNNILQAPNWRTIFDELVELSKRKGLKIDFNQGLDARLITDEVVEKLSCMRLLCIRLAYDRRDIGKFVERAITKITSYGIRGRKIFVYLLYNFDDDPEDFFLRLRDILNWGAVAFPMRYQPLNALEKDVYIAPRWSKENIEKLEKFRRIVGFAGTFPPYNWLKDRLNKASSFEEAFEPPPRIGHSKPLRRAHVSYFAAWKKEPYWRNVMKQCLAKHW